MKIMKPLFAFVLSNLVALATANASGGNNFVEMARGISPYGSVGSTQIDSVNPFGGNLTAIVPLGHTLNAGLLSYKFQAAYNNRSSWNFEVYCLDINNPTTGTCFDYAFPHAIGNAGMGWTVTFGELFEPYTIDAIGNHVLTWPNHSDRNWLFVGPDGAETIFACDTNISSYCANASEAVAANATAFVSSDYRSRLRKLSASTMVAEFADGTSRTFQRISWYPCYERTVGQGVVPNPPTCWKLTQIADSAGNWVRFGYDLGNVEINITDSKGRTHIIKYKNSPSPLVSPTELGHYPYVVDYVQVNSNGAAETYTFNYQSFNLPREFPYNAFTSAQISRNLNVPLLMSISVPVLGPYTFGYFTGTYIPSTPTHGDGWQGVGALQSYTTPTGLSEVFAYGTYILPKPCNFNLLDSGSGNLPHFDDISGQQTLLWGVTSRTESGPGIPTTTTGFNAEWDANYSNSPVCVRPKWYKSYIDHPANSAGYFRRDETWFSIARTETGNWHVFEYGLPMNKDSSAPSNAPGGPQFLSSSVSQCTSSNNCSIVSSDYVQYFPVVGPNSLHCEIGDAPSCAWLGSVRGSHGTQVYGPPGSYTEHGTSVADYDGVGHWRTQVDYSLGYGGTSANQSTVLAINSPIQSGFVGQPADGVIRLTTNFYGQFFGLPSFGNSWQLDLPITKTVSGNGATEKTTYCYDARSLLYGVVHGDASASVGHWYLRTINPDGQPSAEPQAFAPSMLNACSATLDVQRFFAYDGWGHNTDQTVSSFNLADQRRTFDGADNLITDTLPSGTNRTFQNYDLLGRPATILSTGRANTALTYANPAVGRTGAVTISSGSVPNNVQATITYDALSRPIKETFNHPKGTRTRTTTYDNAGNIVKIDINATAVETRAFDALGRPTTVTYADGTTATNTYTGDRLVVSTRGGASTTTEYDAFGRVYRLTTGSSSDGSAKCTESSYDNSGRLTQQKLSSACGANTTQTRKYTFNSAGFKTSQTIPETGTETYSDFDSYGNPQTVVDGAGTTFSQLFDLKGRLTKSSEGSFPLVEFVYSSANCNNGTYCPGQISSRTRHNRSTIDLYSDWDVTDTYTYGNADGAVSQIQTYVEYPTPGGIKESRTFTQTFGTNDLGMAATQGYPSCADCGAARTVKNDYSAGYLNSVSSGASTIATLDYTPIGELLSVTFPDRNAKNTFGYKTNGIQLDSINAAHASATLWQTGQYKYDDRSRIKSIGENLAEATTLFDYDNGDRLISSSIAVPNSDDWNQTFGYDTFDNLTSKTSTVGFDTTNSSWSIDSSTNRVTKQTVGDSGSQSVTSTFHYDPVGRLHDDGCLNYTYDPLGALFSVSPSTSANGRSDCQLNVGYLYDAGGERVLAMCTQGCDGKPPAPDFTLRAYPPRVVLPNSTFTVTWSAITNADSSACSDDFPCSCTASGDWSGDKSTSGGSETFSPTTTDPTLTLEYQLTCTGRGGSTVRTSRVEVDQPPPLACALPPSVAAQGNTAVSIAASCSGGYLPYTIKWQFSPTGANATDFTDITDGAGISGSATQVLALAGSQARVGWYRVSATDSWPITSETSTAVTKLNIVNPAVVGEVGTAQVSSNPVKIHFQNTSGYLSPVVFAGPHGASKGIASVVRISHVTSNSFVAQIQNAIGTNPAHRPETVDYVVFEEGTWQFPFDSTSLLEVHKVKQFDGLYGLFAHAYSFRALEHANMHRGPILLAQPQTFNFAATAKVRTFGGADYENTFVLLALELWDAVTSVRNQQEDVGWAVMSSPNAATWSGLPFESGLQVSNGNWGHFNFHSNLGGSPRFIASMDISAYANSSDLRRKNLTATGVDIVNEYDFLPGLGEEFPADNLIDYVAFGGSGILMALPIKSDSTCSVPSITTQPINQSVAIGAPYSFGIAATGTAPLTIQWSHDGALIDQATALTLSNPAAQVSDAGEYAATVTNSCGTTLSSLANLKVGAANQTPFNGSAVVIPGTIQGEDVDRGGQGISYNDSTPDNLGSVYRTDSVDVFSNGADYYLGAFDSGEWFEYTANIASAGSYDLDVRFAAAQPGSYDLDISQDGRTAVSGTLTDTGGDTIFQVATIPAAQLLKGNGSHLRMGSDIGGLNIDWIKFRSADSPATVVSSDDFFDVSPGQPIDSRALPSSDTDAWIASPDAIASNLRNVTGMTGATPTAVIPYNQLFRGNNVAVVEAQLNPAGAGWVAIGLTQAPRQGWIGSGQLWAYVNSSGRFAVFANGTSIALAPEQAIPASAVFRTNDYNQVRLIYDPNAARVEFWINGVRVAGPIAIPSSFVPTVQYAGWSGYQVTQDVTRIDGFIVSERDAASCASPLVTLQPAGRSVAAGDSVTFSTAVNGTAPITVQWQKSPVGSTTFVDIPGATGLSYSVGGAAGVQASDAGNYRARFQNGCGSNVSNAAALSITAGIRTAFLGADAIVPGVIQGENVDLGTEGTAYHDTAAGNQGDTTYRSDDVDSLAGGSGHILGAFDAGEWDEYSADLSSDGANTAGTPLFTDVPVNHPRRGAIEAIFRAGITTGCSSTTYCPNRLITRGEAAVFLIVASSPPGYIPPACTQVFTDVPCTTGGVANPFAPYINEVAHRGITAGCSPTTFCPDRTITRGEMAVFLVVAGLGSSFSPQVCTSKPFDDVDCTYYAVKFIAEAIRRNFMEPCTALSFCPDQQVTRGDMASMLVNTFGLPAAAHYQAEVRYSSGVAGTHALQLGVDGQAATSNTLDSTNGWDNYQTVTLGTFTGSSGNHSGVRAATSTGGLNVDWMRLRYADPAITWSVADSFNSAAAGSGLSGRTLPVGSSAIWNAGSEIVIGNQGNATVLSLASPIAVVAYNPSTRPGSVAQVEAQLKTGASGWLAVGFVKAPAQGWIGTGQVWALVKPEGRFAVFANGTSIPLVAERDIPANAMFRGAEYNQAKLVYDQTLGRVEFWINGMRVYGPAALPAGFVPTVNYAGWSGLGVGSDSAVDGFVLSERGPSTCPLPLVAQDPLSQNVYAGSSPTFAPVFNGSATGYQWQKDGLDLAGATLATLSIANVQSANAGAYRVRVTNTCGSTTSNSATLTVSAAQVQSPWLGTPFAIPGKIEGELVDKGGEGVAYHDTTPGNVGDANLRMGADDVDVYFGGSGYVLGHFEPNEWVEYTSSVATAGNYDVDIRYSAQGSGTRTLGISSNGQAGVNAILPSTDNWSTYELFTAPALTLSAGANVIKLSANGEQNIDWIRIRPAQPTTTQKLRDDFEGVPGGTALTGHQVPGTSNVFWNGVDGVIEALGDVTGVTGASPVGTIAYTPGANKQAMVEAQLDPTGADWLAIGFTQAPLQGWIGNGQLWVLVKPNGRFAVFANGTSSVVAAEQPIPPAGDFRPGEYNQVRLIYDPASRSAEVWMNGAQILTPTVIPNSFVPIVQYAGWQGHLVVQSSTRLDGFVVGERDASCVAPLITLSPVSQIVAVGSTATFTSAASGTNLTYQWQKDGVDLTGVVSANTATLSIPNVQTANAGSYQVRVSNSCASSSRTSTAATLTISVPQVQSPWLGTPFAIPGKIEGELVDKGGEGVAYHDTTLGNVGDANLRMGLDDVDVYFGGSGYVLGHFEPTEWVEYTSSVATAGNYDVDIRYSAQPGGTRTLGISSNGQAGVNAILSSTDNWSTYELFTAPALTLSAGANVIKLSANNGEQNIDWIRIRPAQPTTTQKLRDDFEGAPANTPLSGRTVPGSTTAWVSANAVIESTGDVIGATGTGPFGTLAYAPTPGKQSVVEAQMDPTGAEWLAIGFTQAPAQGWFGTGQLWMLIKPAGRFAVLANGTTTTVAAEQAIPPGADYRPGEFNQVRLIYNPVGKTAEAWINGVQVLAPTLIPNSFVPVVQYAGWSGLNVSQGSSITRIDGFVLSER